MSCFQGRPQHIALNNVMELNPEGLQLTPGNHPSPNFKESITVPYRFHHGFCWSAYRREVYNSDLMPINIGYHHSIHPPETGDFNQWISKVGDYVLECMYPGYLLGTGEEIEVALKLRKRLAIDISHLFIMKSQGVISNSILNKILDYDLIEEIHISHNDGKYDSHRPISESTPYLDWAKGRKGKTLLVYESYLHKLSLTDRLKQLEIIRG